MDGGILERAVFRARCGLIRYLHGRLIGIYNTPWEPLHAQAAAAFAPGPGEPGFG